MFLSELSIRRPVLATMMTAAMVVFGIVAYLRLGVDLFPDVDIPIVTVTTVLEGADPETVESTITDLIEEAVNTISGIKTLRSESTEGVSLVFIEFELEEDQDIKAQEVRDKVAIVRADLPREIEAPIVDKFDLDSSPIVSVVISGEGYTIQKLTDYADDVIKERLQSISGVGSIKILGGREREIRIWVDPSRLEARLLSVSDVIDALQKQNVEIPGGRIETGMRELVVKTEAKIEDAQDFNNLVLSHVNGSDVLLSDVARVEDGLEDERTFARLNGKRAVALEVRRQSGTNLVAIAERVKEDVRRMKKQLPRGMAMEMATDNSVFIKNSIDEVKGHLVMGGFLAVLVVFFFLRNWRSTAVVAIVIPTSVVATFSLILAMGFTLNMMTLLALTLSVGILIDDAIVMVENCYRHVEAGEPPIEASRRGSKEIVFALLAASMSLLAVFVPVAFMTGMVGRFFFEFGMTMSFVIIISTFIALTLTPMLCSRMLKHKTRHNFLFRAVEAMLVLVEKIYRAMLRFSLVHPIIILLITTGVFVGSGALLPFIGTEFVPIDDESEFSVFVKTPTGSSVQYTGAIIGKVEEEILRYPGVERTYAAIGGGAQEKVNEGSIHVIMAQMHERGFSQFDLMAAVRERFANMPGIQLSASQIARISGGGLRNSQVQFNIRGPSLVKLEEYSNALLAELKKSPGLVDLDSTFEAGKPEVRLNIDRRKAADMGVEIDDLATVTRDLIGGIKVTKFEADGEQYDVRVRALEAFRDSPEGINSLQVRTKDGLLALFRNLVTTEVGVGPTQIDRQSRQRQVTILANLQDLDLGEAIEIINAKVAALNLPDSYKTGFTGDAELMAESFASIVFSLFLAIIITYMILAAQFEAYTHPFTILMTVPLAVVGAFVALYLTGRTLNIFSMIGLIVLVGLVTKNAILLIDYTNQLRREKGMNRKDALLQACPVRLRPILMTAFSTIAGSLPIILGLGVGAQTRAPMATAIAGGLLLSTMLTLLVVPVVYTLLDQMVGLFKRTKKA
jgi:hydrophobic/amphiphilic exporter-1 (mainly G- bacteria), HAE1 family